MDKNFFVYILASGYDGTFYIGVTSDLPKRIWEHKNKVVKGFTEKYDVCRLVCFERHDGAEAAIAREKRMKEWKPRWKINLIEETNQDGPICMRVSVHSRFNRPRGWFMGPGLRRGDGAVE